MENTTFKSVAFGGFDKQDVIRYIEQSAQEAAAAQEQLQKENERLQLENGELEDRLNKLQQQLAETAALLTQTQEDLKQAQAERRALEGAREEADRLAAEMARLRPEAESYARFRDRVGDIECDAHKRAAELEATTTAKLQRTVELFRTQYEHLMTTFGSTADYVTAELRKVEVNLTQLPRAMDQAGKELRELSDLLDQAGKKEE